MINDHCTNTKLLIVTVYCVGFMYMHMEQMNKRLVVICVLGKRTSSFRICRKLLQCHSSQEHLIQVLVTVVIAQLINYYNTRKIIACIHLMYQKQQQQQQQQQQQHLLFFHHVAFSTLKQGWFASLDSKNRWQQSSFEIQC
jgi:hypothetical protein